MSKILDWDRRIGRQLRLRDLHVFSIVVQLGSMAKAAAHLRVTQPAVSQVIADLEHLLGVKLLDRRPQGVEPTIYGVALFKGGAAAFDDLKQTVKQIEFLANPAVGEIRIGCPETVATLMAPVVERFTSRHPGIILHVIDAAAPTLDLPALRERTLDLALVRVAGLPSIHRLGDDLNVEVLLNDETLVVVGRESRWARRRKLKLVEIADQLWILPPANSLNSSVVMDAFRLSGLGAPKVSLVTYSVQLRANLVTSGQFITVFPRSLMRLSADRMALKALPISLPSRDWPIAMVTLKNRMINPAVELFVEAVRRAFQSLAREQPS